MDAQKSENDELKHRLLDRCKQSMIKSEQQVAKKSIEMQQDLTAKLAAFEEKW